MASIFVTRLRKALAAVGFGVRSSATQADADVPLVTSGSGAASASDPNGSLRLRTNGLPEYRIGSAWKIAPIVGTITDPGNAGAIPVTHGGSCAIVTAGAETRTLAVPTYAGQVLILHLQTDGGDCVITVAAAFNATGNNTITLNDAGDTVILVGLYTGAAFRWRVVLNETATLSTV